MVCLHLPALRPRPGKLGSIILIIVEMLLLRDRCKFPLGSVHIIIGIALGLGVVSGSVNGP